MDGYDIDFVAIIRYKMHECTLGELTTLPFPCLVYLLYDEVSVPEILGVDHRVKVLGVAHKCMINNL